MLNENAKITSSCLTIHGVYVFFFREWYSSHYNAARSRYSLTYGRDVRVADGLVGETRHEARLSHPAVAEQHEALQNVVVLRADAARGHRRTRLDSLSGRKAKVLSV